MLVESNTCMYWSEALLLKPDITNRVPAEAFTILDASRAVLVELDSVWNEAPPPPLPPQILAPLISYLATVTMTTPLVGAVPEYLTWIFPFAIRLLFVRQSIAIVLPPGNINSLVVAEPDGIFTYNRESVVLYINRKSASSVMDNTV